MHSIDTRLHCVIYRHNLNHLHHLQLELLKISNRSSMPWNYDTYQPRTDRYGAAYYGMLAGPPRDRQLRYEPSTDPRDSRRTVLGTASRGMRRSMRSEQSVPNPRRAASEVPTYRTYHRPPSIEEPVVPYALQPPDFGSRPTPRRLQPTYQVIPDPRRSDRRPVSSGYYSERSNLSIPSSMHGQVSSSRDSSVRPTRAHVDPVLHDRFRDQPVFDAGSAGRESSRRSREGGRNELRQAAKDFDRREHGRHGEHYRQTSGRWYDRGLWDRLRRGARRW